MTLVRMLVDWRGGGRANGGEWPAYGGLIELDEWEAEQVIRGGNAELASEEELERGYDVLRIPDPNFEDRLREGYDEEAEETDEDLSREEPEEVDFGDDFDRDEDDTEVTEIKRPYTNANKDEWIDYAAYKGADRKEVAELTKAQIISKYGE